MQNGAIARSAAWLPLFAGLVAVAGGAWILRDTFVGDPTIYLVYARNAAAGHLFQFNVGEFSSGVASPLWSLVLAVPFVLGLGVAGAKAWAAVWAIAAVLATAAAARRLSGSDLGAAVGAVAVVPAMAFFGVMTYDSGLTVTLVALSLVARGRRLGLLWAGLLFSRPETAIIVGLEAVALGWRRHLAMAIASAIPAAVYYGYSQLTLGSYTVSNAARTIDQSEFAGQLGPLLVSTQAAAYVVELLPLAAIAGYGLWRGHRWGILALGAFALMLVFYPVTMFVPRYALPVMPVVAVGVGIAIRQRPVLALIAAALLTLPVLGSILAATAESRRGFSFETVTEQVLVARVNEIASPGAAVLGFEVQDRWSLRPDLRYLAVNGLTDGLITSWRARGDVTGYLRAYRPEIWIAQDLAFGRNYVGGTILEAAYGSLVAGSDHVELEGIGFDVIWRNTTPVVPGFARAPIVVRLTYPSAAG